MDKPQIAVVVPTIRPESYKKFCNAWKEQFERYSVSLVKVEDGDVPLVNGFSAMEVMGKYADLIYNKNDGVRNLGFAFVAKRMPWITHILSLDDDVEPYGDTIGDHLGWLGKKVSISWVSTASDYMRGYPYNVRGEAEVVVSHGVWHGVADWDAPSQLVKGNPSVEFARRIIPKGALYPHCAMNFMFSRKALPYIYQAPMFGDLNRFADIWGGIECKKDLDQLNMAVVTGVSAVHHTRASNVFENIIKEARGLKMNEEYGKDPYFKLFFRQRDRWKKFIKLCSSQS